VCINVLSKFVHSDTLSCVGLYFVFYFAPHRELSIVMTVSVCACLSVCKHISGNTLQSSPKFVTNDCGSVPVCYVLLDLFITSCLHIMARNIGDGIKEYTQGDLTRGSTDLTPWYILRLSTGPEAESDIIYDCFV